MMNVWSDDLLLYANAAVCALITLRLLFYRRGEAAYHPAISLLAYGLAVAAGSVTLRIAFGVYEAPVDWAELFINATVCASLFAVKGNLARLFRPIPAPRIIRRIRYGVRRVSGRKARGG